MGALGLQAQALMLRAAQAGMPRAWELMHLTPRDIELAFTAHAARQQRELEALDLQAWLTGRYVLSALHAPRRYPRRPDGILRPRPPMTDAQIKGVLMRLAEQRRE